MPIIGPSLIQDSSLQFLGRSIWAYQDFTAGAISNTSVTITANENGDNALFDSGSIVGNTATIFSNDDPLEYAYTSVGKFFGTLITVDNHSATSITLNKIPSSSTNIRIWYKINATRFPENYSTPPLALQAKMLDNMEAILLTQDELNDLLTTTSNLWSASKINTEVQAVQTDVNNITWALSNVSANVNPAIPFTSYFVTSASVVTITLPDSALGNDAQFFRIIKIGGAGTVNITTVGGTQLIGSGTIRTITIDNTGITIQSNFSSNKYDIVQDSTTDTLASNVELLSLGNASFPSLQEMQDIYHSTGHVTGGGIVDNLNGTIDVASGSGYLRATIDISTTLFAVDWLAAAAVSLTDNSNNFIYIEYNGGTPQVSVSVTKLENQTNILLAQIFREGTTLHIFAASVRNVGDHAGLMIDRQLAIAPFAHESGAIASETGTRNFAITAGVFWEGLKQFTTTAHDFSVSGSFSYFYSDGASGWTEITSATQIDNTQYDNGSGTLATLSNNRYGVHWIYLDGDENDSDVSLLFGHGDYTLSQANAAGAPATAPPRIVSHAKLIGKIIIKKSDVAFTSIESAFETAFITSTVSDHNNLATLQGGIAGEYYHLTAAQHASLTSLASLSGGDGIDYNSGTGIIVADINTTNLKITAAKINTIQDIRTTADFILGSCKIFGQSDQIQTLIKENINGVQILDIFQIQTTAGLKVIEVEGGGGANPYQTNFNGDVFFGDSVIFNSATEGSVAWFGAGGSLSQDNANFFYDFSAKSLKVNNSVLKNRFTSFASFSHSALTADSDYALLQSSDGDTFLNCSTGKSIFFRINNADAMEITSNGVIVGSPIGGFKNAGTINAKGVYDDNVLLTDYIFEIRYNGKAKDKKFKDYKIKSLDEEEKFVKKNLHLSTIIGREKWEEKGASTGEMIVDLWKTVETQFLYITELKKEINNLQFPLIKNGTNNI